MQRTTAAYTVAGALILTLVVMVADNVSAHTRPAHPAGGPERVRACGVERWAVKIGIDPDARLVNQRVVVPTTIVHLRSLPAPHFLPLHARLRPVETTVWALDAILLRYRVEEDSDVHLVVADTGGRTMITEIPAPQCVSASSPFLPAIKTVRRAFTARFHPHATLYARSSAGAVCTASVVYSTGHAPRSFDGSARTVGSSGVVSWTWHMQSSGTGGTATVTCAWHGQTRSATTSFSISS